MNHSSADLQTWVGNSETTTDLISEATCRLAAATLGYEHNRLSTLPPGWQWFFFHNPVTTDTLGHDGHPPKGGFLPPVSLPRRMWAGSRLHYTGAIEIGSVATKVSTIRSVVEKSGKSGSLCFVTVHHEIFCNDQLCIREEQDIVYRDPPPADGAAAKPQPYQRDASVTEQVMPTTPLLFRYSALTFNSHRIHYDRPYATEQEGYPDLVVHGPLIATLLQDFAQKNHPREPLGTFEFRGASPLFVNDPLTMAASTEDLENMPLWVVNHDGALAMSAQATFGSVK